MSARFFWTKGWPGLVIWTGGMIGLGSMALGQEPSRTAPSTTRFVASQASPTVARRGDRAQPVTMLQPIPFGPNDDLQQRYEPLPPPPRQPRLMRDYSWILIEQPPPPEIRVHDIVTVIVDEKAESFENDLYNRQKTGIFKAELKEFVRIDDEGNLANGGLNKPKIDATMQSNLNTRAQVQNREGIRYRIAATVVDVLPNGTVILEARKSIRTNRDVWEYKLSGRIRSKDIQANNTVLSENVVDLYIERNQKGRAFDATKRGFLLTIYDWLLPI